jgi:ketosteroid isomerase-like protein
MSDAEAKVAVIHALHDAWDRGESGAELFHPDVEWSTPHPGGTVHGRDELLAFLRSFIGAWAEYRNDLEEVRVLPDGRLLVLFTEVARGRSSGAVTELNPGALVEIRDGLIARYEGMERDEAMRAAGLVE